MIPIDPETVRGLGTLFLLLAFVALCAWAYRPANRARFEADGMLPFRDDPREPVQGEPR